MCIAMVDRDKRVIRQTSPMRWNFISGRDLRGLRGAGVSWGEGSIGLRGSKKSWSTRRGGKKLPLPAQKSREGNVARQVPGP